MTDRNIPSSHATAAGHTVEKPLIRDDGSKVATEGSPAGETETEKVRREESKLPNRGVSPDYDEPEAGDGVAVVDKPPQNEHDEQLITKEFSDLDSDLVGVETFGQTASNDGEHKPSDMPKTR